MNSCGAGSFALLLHALLAQSVKHRAHRVQREMMVLQKMGADAFQFIAVQVDQFSAFFALAVEADRILACFAVPHILKAGGAVPVDDIFFYDALIDHLFQMPVDRRHADLLPALPEALADIRRSDVLSPHALEVIQHILSLVGHILHPVRHTFLSTLCAVRTCRSPWDLYTLYTAS